MESTEEQQSANFESALTREPQVHNIHVNSLDSNTLNAPGSNQSNNAQNIDAKSLFNGRREILISHKGEQYRLRMTRNEKLILTK